MKKILIIIIPVFVMLAVTGCLKDTPNVDFSHLNPMLEITTSNTNSTPNAPSGGMAFFSAATLNFSSAGDPDTIWFTANLASNYPLNRDVPVSIDIDQAALAAYISDTTHVQYQVFPDSTFTIPAKTGVIRAGTRLDTFYVIFHPTKVDPTKSYMLPLTLKTSSSGVGVSGNLSTIYFHFVGNPLAGNYIWDFTRWNNQTGTGTPSGSSFKGQPTTFVPVTPTQVEVADGYYIQPRYEISFTNKNGVLSNFTVTLNSADVAQMASAGVTVVSPPKIIILDPVNKVFEFQYTVFNGSAYRYLIDKYHQ